jgi:hypothetical protein
MSRRQGIQTPPSPKYLMPDFRLRTTKITDFSYWFDDVWFFPPPYPGFGIFGLNWRLGCSDRKWHDENWQRLINLSRRFVSSLLEDNRSGRNIKPITLRSLWPDLRLLINWMHSQGYRCFAELDRNAFSEFFKSAAAVKVDQELENSVTIRSLANCLCVPLQIFRQSRAFQTIPELVVPVDPLGGSSPFKLAKTFGAVKVDHVPPVPDQIFHPATREALSWIGVRSVDVIRLLELYEAALTSTLTWNSNNYSGKISRALIGFQFTCGGTSEPWRPRIAASVEVTTRTEYGMVRRQIGPLAQFGDILRASTDASSLLIQALLGMRISEVAGLQALPLQPNGWPACIQLRPTLSGMREAFYVVGKIYKGRSEPRDAEWIAGVRPLGTEVIPPAIQAILFVFRLLQFWRDLSGKTELFVSVFQPGGGLSRGKESIRSIRSNTLRIGQSKFIDSVVDVAEEFRDWRITTQQWRKRFAQDILRSDPDAAPEIRLHFHHISDHILDDNYYGNDAELLKVVEDESIQLAANEIVDIVFGTSVRSGRIVEALEDEASGIRALCGSARSQEEKVKAVSEALATDTVRLWPGEYGDCIFRYERARCHLASKGAFDPLAMRPNPTERCADLCCVCSNLSVSMKHKQFWVNRHSECISAYRRFHAEGYPLLARFNKQRARRAALILSGLKVEIVQEDGL